MHNFVFSLVSLLNKVVEVFSVLCNQIDYLQPYARDLAVQICFRNYPKKPLRFALDFPVLYRFVSETIKTLQSLELAHKSNIAERLTTP